MSSTSSAVASSPSVRQLAMSPAATTCAEGVGKPQPTAMRRKATVATITPVAVLLLLVVTPTPTITCRLPMGLRYPRDLWMARIPITCPSWGAPTNSQEQAYSPECVEVEFSVLPLLALILTRVVRETVRKASETSKA